MAARLSGAALKLTLMLLAFGCAALLLRDGLAIAAHVPLDPDEGWNAYHALAAMTGTGPYPPSGSLMVNNYPPLSFYIVGALGRMIGDYIVAGRVLSLIAFVAACIGLAMLLRQLGAAVLDSLFAALTFGGALLVTSNYVAMDDPQLIGHVLQIEALLLLLRDRPATIAAAALLAAGVFIKHNLIALPLTAMLWMLWQNRMEGARLALSGLAFGLAGLLAVRLGLGIDLLRQIAAPRAESLANLQDAVTRFASWSALPLAVTLGLTLGFRRDKWIVFAVLYTAIALALGVLLSAGDGVDANIFFDCDLALALAAGLMLGRLAPRWRGLFALTYALPLALFLYRNFNDDNFAYSESFQRQTPIDIAFLEVNRGPALCETLALCYWAGKDAQVDVFNIAEQFKTGARSDTALGRLIEQRFFHVVEFDTLSPFALGGHVRSSLLAHYRIVREDDNGVFLVPK